MDKQMLEYIYYVVYGGVTVLSLVASCYLLFRRANAFNPDKGGQRKDTQRGIGVYRQPLRGRGELQVHLQQRPSGAG